jgi:hypothetical protein
MVVNDFNVESSFGSPAKTQTPLIVDPNAVLAPFIASECF